MSVDVHIVGGNGEKAIVNSSGQLITSPIHYSSTVFIDMDVINTPYNVLPPKSGLNVVITGLVISANRNVGNDGANVVLYTATAPDELTVVDTILQGEIAKSKTIPLTPLNLIIDSDAYWINAKTDDDDVFLTVMYYYV